MEVLKSMWEHRQVVLGLIRTSTLATFGSPHPTSSRWDHATTMTVEVLRALLFDPTKSIDKVQNATAKARPVKGKLWSASTTVPNPGQHAITSAIVQAIETLGDGTEQYTRPDAVPFQAQWIGSRSGAADDEEAPEIPEEEKYKLMMGEKTRTSSTTMLYFHGGQYYMHAWRTHRQAASRLAKACGGRVLLIEYRLAPQTAFPGQLIDALNAYLYLMYPPEGSFHEAVPAGDIVFAGDGAGGNLAASLMQLLLHMQRTKPAGAETSTVLFHGKSVPVPLPAGIATLSGWFDVARAMPSVRSNQIWDYLPPADHDNALSQLPKDDIWPTTPPRGDIFCDLSLLCHPLVSPIISKDWSGCPPMYMMTGELELLVDENTLVAVKAAEHGVTMVWEQYEAMPHAFPVAFPDLEISARCINAVGYFARECVESDVKSRATWIARATGKESPMQISTNLTWEYALARMVNAQLRRFSGYKNR
jgi:acetyl esterase/lipase